MKYASTILFVSLTLVIGCSVRAQEQPTVAESELGGRPQHIFMTLDCSYQCKNQDPVQSNIQFEFDPTSLGLSPGNGEMLRYLAMETWGAPEEACLTSAAEACNTDGDLTPLAQRQAGLQNVADFKLNSIVSSEPGHEPQTWRLDHRPACPETEYIVSPYDPSKAPATSADGELKLYSPSDIAWLHTLPVPTSLVDPPCVHPIQVNTCVGDCLVLSEAPGAPTGAQSLATPDVQPSPRTLCADDFIAYERAMPESTSRDVLTARCQRYLTRSFTENSRGNLMLSCAAFRFSDDCSGVIDAILQ